MAERFESRLLPVFKRRTGAVGQLLPTLWENATAVIWKTLLIAERTFRRLDAPELLAEVAEGVTYVDGVRVKSHEATEEKVAA